MIRKLKDGRYRLYSRKKNPKTGKRRNLGTFNTRAAAEKHERAVQFFKRGGAKILLIALSLQSQSALAQSPASWPTKSWPTAVPQAVGLNAAVLDSIDSEIRSGQYGYVDRMLVIRRGRIAYDRSYRQNYDSIYADSARTKGPLNAHELTSPYNYFLPWWHPYYRRGDLHTLQSVTKTITSVVIGVATTRGEFPSIDTPVLSFFDAAKVANVDDRKRRMTIRHLLTMTAGFDWNEGLPYADPRNSAVVMEASYDWIKFTIDRPMSEEPGTRFNYNSGASELLAHIFRRATGTDIEEYASRHLFAPLGIERWFWKRTPAGLVDTEGGLYLEARDLAKIWYLFTRNGLWDGRRIVSEEWVRSSVTPAIATGSAPNAARYGLKWWLFTNPTDSTRYVWAGSGFGGQVPIAIPEDDMILVFNGWNILPGQRGLPVRRTLARLAAAVVDRGRTGIRFDPSKLRPGDRVGPLMLQSIDARRTPIDSTYVGTARFGGTVELSGATMRHHDSDVQLVCFEADPESAARLPRWEGDDRRPWFCFENQALARRALGPPSDAVKATVVIDRFLIHRGFSDYVNSARLVRVVARPR